MHPAVVSQADRILRSELRMSACGLLLTYAWLVSHKSDFDIAKEHGLLRKDMEQPNCVGFLDVYLDNIDLETLSDVSKWYKLGELRLNRLNAVYRQVRLHTP